VDFFVHANQLPASVQKSSPPLLTPGQQVRFRHEDDPRGPKAISVTLAGVPDVLSEDEFLAELHRVFAPAQQHDVCMVEIARGHGWVK
jgi:cold shock CspA family protein